MSYDPTFSSKLRDIDRNNTIYVENLSALPAPVANVITLTTGKKYVLTKPLNTGTYQLQIPTNGNVQLVSNYEPTNTLTTELTGNTPLFIGDLARLVIQDLDIISGTGTSKLFNIIATTASRAVVIHQRSFVQNFASLGTIDGATSIKENVVFFGNGEGITLHNNGAALGAGITWNSINFINQTGTHITATGSSNFVSFNIIVATPASAISLFNLDGLTVTGTSDLGAVLIDGSLGGITGLIKTYTADQTLANIFTDIRVDTTSNPVTIELPDTSAASYQEGYSIDITDTGNASTNEISIIPNANDSTTINGGLIEYNITEDGGSVLLQKHGDTWEIINRFNQKSILTVLSTSTLSEIYDVIIGDPTGGAFITTLPTAVGRRGKFVVLKKSASALQWTVRGNGSETIDGVTNLVFTGVNRPGATIMSNGANWLIIEEA